MLSFQSKRIIYAAIIIAVICIILFFIFYFHGQSNKVISGLKAIPEDAAFVVQIDNVEKFSALLNEKEELKIWYNFSVFQKISDEFQQILKNIKKSSDAIELSEGMKLLISLHNDQTDFQFLVAVELTRSIAFQDVSKILSNIAKESGFENIIERKGDHKLILSKGADSIYVVHVDNILVFSVKQTLVEQSIEQLLSDDESEWQIFSKHNAQKNELISVFVKNSSLKNYFEHYFYQDKMFPFFLFPDSGSIAVISGETGLSLQTNGIYRFDIIEDSLNHQELTAWRNSMQQVAFHAVCSSESFSFSLNFPHLISKVGFEFVFLPHSGETRANSMLIFDVPDTAQFMSKTKLFADSASIELQNSFNFNGESLFKLNSDSLFGHNSLIQNFSESYKYFILTGNTLLLGTSPDIIENVVNDRLIRDGEFIDTSLIDTNNDAINLNIARYYPYFLISVRPEFIEIWKSLYPILSFYGKMKLFVNPENKSTRIIEFDKTSNGSTGFIEEIADFMISRLLYRNEIIMKDLIILPQQFYEGQVDGNYSFFYPDSILKVQGMFLNGKANGTWRFYFEDGKYQASVEYVNGNAEGKAVFYRPRPEGKMLFSCSFRKNKINGQYIEFHKNGKPSLSTIFTDGQMNNKVRLYYPLGIIMAEADMQNNTVFSGFSVYSVMGDFIDPLYVNESAKILNNYISFIEAQSGVLKEKAP